jgi:hypothetical protein
MVTVRQGVPVDDRDTPSWLLLTAREREMLGLLLALDAPGVDALRTQAEHATVAKRCACGCPTIELAVDGQAAAPADLARWPVFSWARAARTSSSSFHVILFVRDGWLSELEYVALSDPVPTEFPARVELAPAVSGDTPLGPIGAPR